MDQKANLRAIEALGSTRSSIDRFSVKLAEIVVCLSRGLREIRDWIDLKVEACIGYLEDCRERVRWAKKALDACLSQEDDDYCPNCSNEEEALAEARRAAREAVEALDKARMWRRNIIRGLDRFAPHAGRLRELAADLYL